MAAWAFRGRTGILWVCLVVLAVFYTPTRAFIDPFTIAGGAFLLGSGGVIYNKFGHNINCHLRECCDAPYVKPDFQKLERDLKELVYGQHLVQETVVPALRAHFEKQPSKPLVLSFNGATGSGKNHVARLIANALYQKGLSSQYVHHLVATADFPDRSRMQQYQIDLQTRISDGVKACGRSLFIFDEVDKLPEALLGSIKPFLDYYDTVRGLDFRSSIFILLSNAAASEITTATVRHRASGQPRGKLKSTELERLVAEHAFNTPGGLKMSELISNHLIDFFVPFLPLEREHVRKCAMYYMEQRWAGASKDEELVNAVLGSLQYFPADDPVYSSAGCKRVETKANVEMARKRQKWAEQHKNKQHDPHDEI